MLPGHTLGPPNPDLVWPARPSCWQIYPTPRNPSVGFRVSGLRFHTEQVSFGAGSHGVAREPFLRPIRRGDG